MGKALEVPILDETFDKVAVDLTTKQYFLVKVSGGTVVLADDPIDLDGLGPLQNKPDVGKEPPSVRTLGVSKVKYGGTVTVGDNLTTDSAGRAVVSAPAAGVTHQIFGRARVSGAVDEIGSMFCLVHTLQTAD